MEVTCPICGAVATFVGKLSTRETMRISLRVQSDFREKCSALAAELPNDPRLEEWDCPNLMAVFEKAARG